MPFTCPSPVPGTEPEILKGPAKFLRSGGDVERVKAMGIARAVGRVVFHHGHHVERSRRRIDHRRAGNAHLRLDLVALKISGGYGCSAFQQTQMPDRRSTFVRIECVNTVVLRGHINNVASTFAGDGNAGNIERLRINLPVDGIGE